MTVFMHFYSTQEKKLNFYFNGLTNGVYCFILTTFYVFSSSGFIVMSTPTFFLFNNIIINSEWKYGRQYSFAKPTFVKCQHVNQTCLLSTAAYIKIFLIFIHSEQRYGEQNLMNFYGTQEQPDKQTVFSYGLFQMPYALNWTCL